jgi:flagellar biosynthesis/type III secretory pathway protein FliH
MISLTDRVEKKSQTLQDSFHLHYFPDIPVDETPDADCSQLSDSGFQRIHFKNLNASCSNATQAPDSTETPEEKKGLSIDEIKIRAFQKGFTEGEKVGFEAGTKRVDPLINSFNQGLEQLRNIRREVHRKIEKEVAQLALSIAKKIVCHEVKITEETVVCVAREALSRVENPGKIKEKLNPADLQFIQDTKSQLSHFLDDVDSIRFEAEDSIRSGGCFIETDMGDIDARVETQLQAIEESFQIEFDEPKQEI